MTATPPRTTAMRPGLSDDMLAVWLVTYYEAAEDGIGRKPNGRCWITQAEAHPLTSNLTVGHQVWLFINQQRPDIPEIDMASGHVQLQGYAASQPDTNGKLPRIHGVLCTACGSANVTFTARSRATCLTCGKGQTQGEAMLCSEHCEDCYGASFTND
ncbi:hypothetical protein AB0N17_38165 [Streptomyces sp. NPDC051133]|uniref:hypothetical protein n=1 Tax=Streptomyces sp. NPDC051133 TaxID=3155521 RepID=UPI003414B56D